MKIVLINKKKVKLNMYTRNCLIIAPLVEKNFLVFTRGGGELLGGAIIRQFRVYQKLKRMCNPENKNEIYTTIL